MKKLSRRKSLTAIIIRTLAVISTFAMVISCGIVCHAEDTGEGSVARTGYGISPGLVIIRDKLGMKKCGVINCDVSFTSDEFISHVSGGGDALPEYITVVSLPSAENAVLKLAGRDVSEGQVISTANLDMLRYVPVLNTVSCDGFSFICDGSGADEAYTCTVNILAGVNTAPECASQDFRVVSGSEIIKYLKAADPDGDRMVFEIVTQPKNGNVTVKDVESGLISYEPDDGYTGNDRFEYVAYDEYGNKGKSTVVTIKVDEGTPGLVLNDMDGHWAKDSALRICSGGLMLPERSGIVSNFCPDVPVTRGDFLAMAMIVTGNEDKVNPGAVSVFADDSGIPANIRCYAAAAYSMGIVSGYEQDGKRFFNWENTITRSEAAAILDRLLDAPSPEIHAEFTDAAAIPGWAVDSVQTLVSLEIMNGDGAGNIAPERYLTRAEAAQLLCNVTEYLEDEKQRLESREKKGFLSFLPFFGSKKDDK